MAHGAAAPAQSLFKLFGIGAAGGLLTVLAHWLFLTLYSNMPFLEFTPSPIMFYSAIVWGGVGALVFALPIGGQWWLNGTIIAFIPALLFLAQQYGVFDGGLLKSFSNTFSGGFWQKALFDKESWIWIVCFMAAWGLFSGYFAKK